MLASRARGRGRPVVTALLAAAVFAFSWLFRFNDPNGSFAGLTDDHFFYLVRGWQLLFGELPVRDFVDHGAPLYYYVGAGVQAVFGRGTLSELAFSVTVLSACAALIFVLAARASGSIPAALVAVAFHILLEPRFYNYPKILVYAVALPLLWRYADAPTTSRMIVVALATVGGFLFRHDHGVFIAIATMTLLLTLRGVPLRVRGRHAAVYVGGGLLLVAPYLIFIQAHGGVGPYFQQASEWAERDRQRAPVVWPGLFDNPDGASGAAATAGPIERALTIVHDNNVAWIYYAELALPLFAMLVLLVTHDAGRPEWRQARAKLLTTAVMAVTLEAGFLRHPLAARLADPSVPLAILIGWLVAVTPLLLRQREAIAARWRPAAFAVRTALIAGVAALALVLVPGAGKDLHRRLEKASMVDRLGKPFERIGEVIASLRLEWQLETWAARADRPELVGLSMYVNACTTPSDRVLVQAYMPQVLALARRGFAGGHADLRPGFFTSREAQVLTVARLQRQSVPMILLETGDAYSNFRSSFPAVTAYLDEHYAEAGTRVFDGRFGVTLLVERNRPASGTYAEYGWPCFGTGLVGL